MAAVTLEADRLTKRFGTRAAVDGLSFAAGAGNIIGLLGPNGAGKTTAIRMLTTMLAPTSGSFTVGGVPHTDPDGIRHRIGVLPESAGYPPRQSAAEYLRFFGRLYGLAPVDAGRLAGPLLAEVGLASRAGSPIGTFSRGMRQRLGIARALINDPAVVFLDEPTLGLDPAGQRQVLSILRDIAARRDATVVLSTHLLSEVEQLCDRVLILDHGRIVTDGSVAEVLSRTAADPHRARLTVPDGFGERARQAAASVEGVQAEFSGRRSALVLSLNGVAEDRLLDLALAAVLDAGVPVLSFQREQTRLADAFLALTSALPDAVVPGGEP
ncbi:MAG: type transport system ATP-binding protein [Pseudonocardiales bacterium]|nr:type transport system ATP-binding protein [Pseudonocardiales bacterium]